MMTPAFARSEKHLNLSGSKTEGTQVGGLGILSHLVKFESGDEVKPTPQGVQAAAPADGATKSSAHAAHDGWPSLAEKEPALQGVGCVEPSAQKWPTEQGRQASFDIYPIRLL